MELLVQALSTEAFETFYNDVLPQDTPINFERSSALCSYHLNRLSLYRGLARQSSMLFPLIPSRGLIQPAQRPGFAAET